MLIAVAALLAALTWAGTRRIWAVAVIAASLIMLVSKAFLPAGYVELTCLPLNGGMAVFIDSGKKAEQLLVDTGNSNAVQFVTCPFLYSHGVNGLSHVALTHGDLKHIGGSQNLAAALPIRRVYASTLRFRSSAWRNAIDHFSAAQLFINLTLTTRWPVGRCSILLRIIALSGQTTARWFSARRSREFACSWFLI